MCAAMFLMAFGGAGPVHADAIARALRDARLRRSRRGAGVTSALGFLTAPMSFELARSRSGVLTQERSAELDAGFEALESEGRELLARRVSRTDEMRSCARPT